MQNGIPPTPSTSHPHSPTQSALTLYPNSITPTQSPTIHQNHTPAPTPSTPTPFTPSMDPVQVSPVGHAQPPRGSPHTLIPLQARVSHRVLRGCRQEGRQEAPDRVGAGEWCRGPTVPCLCPLSLLEGGTTCIGHQPLTQRYLGWPGTGLCGGLCDWAPRPGPTQRLMGSRPHDPGQPWILAPG